VNERLATEWKRKQAIPTLNEPRHYVIHPDSEWKWLHPVDGVDPGTRSPDFHQRYSQLDFDDSAWRSGKDSSRPGSGFGYRPRAGERFPGVDIGIPGDGQRYTAYFRRRFTTTEDAEGLELSCQMEDGIIVYLDGVEVVRDNMQEGPDAYRLSAQGAAGSEATKIQRYAIPGTLPAGDHVVAVSLHTVSPNGDFIYLRFAGIALTARKSQPGE
jgi:hypothetical protein